MAPQKQALVVGASRGLGRGLAEILAARGWRVTGTQRSPAPEREPGDSPALGFETVDIDDAGQVAALHDRLSDRVFDLIFVVAGVATRAHDPLAEVPTEIAVQVYLTNAVAPIRFAEAFLDRLAPGGSIAFMSSVLGSVALNEDGDWDTYRASKAALNTLARSFEARHRAESLSVLLVHPGWVRTDMGGPDADIDVATSVTGIADVIQDRLGSAGCHFLDYRGKPLPW